MANLLDTCQIQLSWETIRQEIFSVFYFDDDQLDIPAFMKTVFPENIYCALFIQNGACRTDLVTAVYEAAEAAGPVFSRMRDLLLDTDPPERGLHPVVQAFRERWESLIPFSGTPHGTISEKERRDRSDLEEVVDDLLKMIPGKTSKLRDHLTYLNHTLQCSWALAILSVMATTLTCFGVKGDPCSDPDKRLQAALLPSSAKNKESDYEKLQASSIKITWNVLHTGLYLKLRPQNDFSGFNDFLEAVVPQDLLIAMCSNSEGKIKKQYKGYVYNAKDRANSHFQKARDFIIAMRSDAGEKYNFAASPVILGFKRNWEALLPESGYSASECENTTDTALVRLHSQVESLLQSIPHESLSVAARLCALCREQPYSMVLAVLSAIASTLFCFGTKGDKCSEHDRALHDAVLPPLPSRQASTVLDSAQLTLADSGISLAALTRQLSSSLKDPAERGAAYYLLYQKALQLENLRSAKDYLHQAATCGYQPAIQKFNEDRAASFLESIRATFAEQFPRAAAIQDCCKKCEEIVHELAYLSEECRGEASFVLYSYIVNGKYRSVLGNTAEYYLELSHQHGYERARDLWIANHPAAITPQFTSSDSPTAGICYCNTQNIYASTFARTIPAAWGGALNTLRLDTLTDAVYDDIPRRFLLLDDDFTKNLEDLFQILQLIMDGTPGKNDPKWEIFIRHDSESIHALVDTALARLSTYQIPVYIINDSLAAAQQLLSQHPLFYPVRAVSLTQVPAEEDRKPLLHFVVIGHSDVTQWLVREAFWMMGFRNNAIRTRITVLADDAAAFETRLKGRFPGMVKSAVRIDGIDMPDIAGENIDLESRQLAEKITAFTEETPYCYFAVAAEDDAQNLALATRVREALIRAAIQSRKAENLHQMPPVAFLCRNDQMALLSRSMVIETEKYGHSWFNTRALIPFGEISGRYSFESISGGIFGLMAKCIHFQYNQLTPLQVRSRTPEAVSAEKDYYCRQYNQDSSYSMSLSLPYRLFQFCGKYMMPISPPGWNILERSTFASAKHLISLSERIELPTDPQEYRAVAEWEHARWVRWMYSRGWLSASFEEAVFAFSEGNKRQQLFAARIHPCICSYEDLKKLEEILYKRCGLKKDFYTYDLDNVRDTKRLLSLEWVIEHIKETELQH